MEEAREEFCDLSPPVSCAVCRSLRQHTTNLIGIKQIHFNRRSFYWKFNLNIHFLKVKNVRYPLLKFFANFTH